MGSTKSNIAGAGSHVHVSVPPERHPSVVVVEAVSAATDTPVEVLPPLYDSTDPDALDAVFGARPVGPTPRPCEISFEYADCTVYVRDRTVTVHVLRP